MKPEDEQPTEEELREAAALAAALEGAPAAAAGADPAAAPADALETAALLRHARAPLVVPPALEPIAAAQAGAVLDARRARRRLRGRAWMIPAIAAPAAAAVFLFTMTLRQTAPPPTTAGAPPPPADLLAAQAQATRGGREASAALATLETKMRAYRRQYHDGLRRGGGRP
jgi:hypothetical protein